MANAKEKAAPKFVLKNKRGKFLKGHSYATPFGYSFSWTANVALARVFQPDNKRTHPGDEGALESLHQLTKSTRICISAVHS